MGLCIHCGNNSGLFRSHHAQCQINYDNALRNIKNLVTYALRKQEFTDSLGQEIVAFSEKAHVAPSDVALLIAELLLSRADSGASPPDLSAEIYAKLNRLLDEFSLKQENLADWVEKVKLTKSADR